MAAIQGNLPRVNFVPLMTKLVPIFCIPQFSSSANETVYQILYFNNSDVSLG
jgi:hypothetical protein